MKRVIEGRGHSETRMIEWIQEGACPICLTATAGMLRERLIEAENVMRQYANHASWLEMGEPGIFDVWDGDSNGWDQAEQYFAKYADQEGK